MAIQKKFYLKERHNPQLGVYYIAMGQMSKTAAKQAEGSIYGTNYMIPFDNVEDYMGKIKELELAGKSIQ